MYFIYEFHAHRCDVTGALRAVLPNLVTLSLDLATFQTPLATFFFKSA